MLLHASSPADIGCESEIVSPLSPILALGEAGCFLPVASPECHHQKTRLPLGNFNLLCKWMFIYAYLVGSFCSLLCEQNITGRSLELHQNITTNISTRPFWNSEQWWMLWRVTQNCHLQPVTTISLSPEHLCPALSPWPCRCGVGHSNAR